jgi:hypothetical protein
MLHLHLLSGTALHHAIDDIRARRITAEITAQWTEGSIRSEQRFRDVQLV